MFNFSLILSGLRAVIAVGAARDRALCALWVALHARIGRMGMRLDRLIARRRAGTLRAPRPSRVSPARARRAAPAIRFPTGKGWVRARLGSEISAFASQMQHQLTGAECQAFLAACPQAGRILRPLLRMLSPDPLPAVVRTPRPAPPRVAAAAEMVGIMVPPTAQFLEV